ncbi:MAG: hypothetical protein HYY65_13445 [Candidatus Tectomicrobia bacterium]|uniref:Uncharacterized protein n=1 Tax=Tectimicrobiota bacterium TaxID=2528274 RepID=A0A932M205_UNCTE|nr:hypothetical protein [Candidatus Tectomicrobia bacterium]
MKSDSAKIFLLLFTIMVVLCAFDVPGTEAATTAPAQSSSDFCGILNAGSVEIPLPVVLVPYAFPDAGVSSLPEVYPIWSLAQSIDHPPELPA